MVTVAAIATLAGGGSAVESWGSEGAAAGGHAGVAAETVIAPLMELPDGCSESWSSEDSID